MTSKKQKTSRRVFLKTTLAAAGGLALTGCRNGTQVSIPTRPPLDITPSLSPAVPIYTDPDRPIAERVGDLVDRMTVDELMSQMQTEATPIERLGIPKYNWWSEAGHGVARAGLATVFPQVIGMAATWNTDLLRRAAGVISDEGRAKHHEFVRTGDRVLYGGLTFFCPNINIFRDPRWGRGQETYGEDPYLTSRLAVEFIRGMQGDDPNYLKTVATAKHFAVHSGPEKNRYAFNAVVSERDLRMTYLPAFQACVTEAKAGSVMSAYNRVNGEASTASPMLLQKILREEWGFDGYVVSDCGAVAYLYLYQGVAKSGEEAAALAVTSGVRPGMRMHLQHPLPLHVPQAGEPAQPCLRRGSEAVGQAAVCGAFPPGNVRSAGAGSVCADSFQRRGFTRPPRDGARSGPPVARPSEEPGRPAAAR